MNPQSYTHIHSMNKKQYFTKSRFLFLLFFIRYMWRYRVSQLHFKLTVCSWTSCNLRERRPIFITRTVKSNSSFTYYTFSSLQFLEKQLYIWEGTFSFIYFFSPLNCSLFTGNTQECQLLTTAVPSFAMLAKPSSSQSALRMDTLCFCTYSPHCKSVFKNTFILADIFAFIATVAIRPWKWGPPCIAVPAHYLVI